MAIRGHWLMRILTVCLVISLLVTGPMAALAEQPETQTETETVETVAVAETAEETAEPAEETPAEETPAEETPAEETPAEETAAEEVVEEAAAPAEEEVTLQPEEQDVYLVGDETVGTVSVESNSQYASFTRTFTQEDIEAKTSGKILKATNADGTVRYYDRLTKANILTETKKNKADRVLTLLGDFTITDADGSSATNCLIISGTNADWGSGNYGDLTIDLNGYTLTYSGAANLFQISRYGFTLQNGNIDYNGTAGRSVICGGTTGGASATSAGVLYAPTITMRNLTVSGTTTGAGTCIVGSYIWGTKLTVDHCELYNGKYGLLGLQGGTGATPKDLKFRPQLTVTNSLLVCGNSTPLYIVKPSQATGGMVASVTVQNSVLVSGSSSHLMVNAGFGTEGGSVATTGCATREISDWSATAFDGSALDGYAYDIQSSWPITFKDGDTVLATLNVAHDAIPAYAAEKEGYALAGWIGEDSTEYTLDSVPTPAETGAATYTAKWVSQIAETVTVQFVNYDGSILQNSAVFAGQSPSYSGDTPTKPSSGAATFVFVGWSDGENVYTDTLPAASNDVTYTAVYSEETMPWAYVSSTEETTYYATLLEAYDANCADDGVGTIKLMAEQYTIGADEKGATTHTISDLTKNLTIDLSGHELVDATGRNLVFINAADNVTFTLMSSNGTGTYTKSGGRGMLAMGTTSASAAIANRTNSVVISNVNVAFSGGTLISGYRAKVNISITDATITTDSYNVVISLQSNKNWDDTVISHYALSFENVDITAYGIFWSSTVANSGATPAENCTASVTLAGANTFKFTSTSYAPQHGFQYRNRSGAYWSLIDPANGYVVPSDSGTMAIVVLPEGPDNGVYTVKTFDGVPVYWDTNGDGIFDSVNSVLPGEAPAHADAEKPFDSDTKTEYTFAGWYDGETLYAPGEALPAVTDAPVYYTAQFIARVADEITAVYLDEDGNEIPATGDLQEILAERDDRVAKEVKLLSDYTMNADLDLFAVSVLDLNGHTISGAYSIVSTNDAVIRNGTVRSTAEAAAIRATGGNLTLEALTVHAANAAAEMQGADSTNMLKNAKLYAGESRGSGIPALIVGAETKETTIDGGLLVTGSEDAPLIAAESYVDAITFDSYISNVYYEEMGNYTWYATSGNGRVRYRWTSHSWATMEVPDTAYTGYRRIKALNPTAKVGSQLYQTLYDAIKAVSKTGGTVTLLRDTDLEEEKAAGAGTGIQYYYVNSAMGAVTIDLNGFTVYGSPTCRTFTLYGANPVTFMNGKLDFSDQGNTAGNYGVLLGTGGSTLRMLNVDMVAQTRAIYLSTGDVNKLVEIIGGSYSMTNTSADNGLVIFSINRINPRAGGNTLRISENAKFTRNAQYAIYMTELDTCEITSAEFHVAKNGKAISEDGVTVYINEEQMTKTEDPASGTYIYTAEAEKYVVSIGDAKYTSLADALKAAKDGDTLKVLRNFSEKLTNAVIPATITIDTNGRTMTFAAGSVVNGVTVSNDRRIDPRLNLQKALFAIDDPMQMNLLFSETLLTLRAANRHAIALKNSGIYRSYRVALTEDELENGFSVWASDGSAYGIPVRISAQDAVYNGDINGDGAVSVKDVLTLRRHLVGGYDVSVAEKAADVNFDGLTNVKDLVLLRRYLVGGYGETLE